MSAFERALATISVLHDLGSDDTATPTAEQVEALRQFPGWGPIAPVFDDQPSQAWVERAATFTDRAQGINLKQARRNVDTSFYTPPQLVTLMWDVVCAAGFTGGRVLDIGCGTGRFLDHAPTGLPIDYTGIDIDPVVTRIGALLHPDARFLTGKAQSTRLGVGYDLAIGNVPFSSAHVIDSTSYEERSLHVVCMKRALASVRAGGYVVMVTSRHVLDGNAADRHWLHEMANLVAAVRLPSRYFSGEGTDVVADVLIMQVRDSADRFAKGWPGALKLTVDTVTERGDEHSVAVSDYWSEHPHYVAGTLVATGYNPSPLAVRADDRAQAVADAFAAVMSGELPPLTQSVDGDDFADVALEDDQGRPEGSFHLVDDDVMRVQGGKLQPVARASKELKALIRLRDAALELTAAEAQWDTPDADLMPLRMAAADLYRDYVATYGPLSRGKLVEGAVDAETCERKLTWKTPTLGGFRRDPAFARVLALEVYDRDADTATPAAVLQRRVNKRPTPITRVDTAGEALAVTLGESRCVDLDRVAGLLGLSSPDEAFTALGDLVYRDPTNSRVEVARDYLSGNVRRKLAAAELAAATDPATYGRNVTALREVQPVWLSAADIRIELGSPVLLASDVADFCKGALGTSYATVTYDRATARWTVDAGANADARAQWGTSHMKPGELVEFGLNAKVPAVWVEQRDEHGRMRKVRLRDETEAAVEALSRIADRFSTWVWEDARRAHRIERAYNRRFNSHVARTPNGDHLPFPRLAEGVQLWPWQKGWVDHALSTTAALAAHEVGLGKTLSALALAVTLREYGLATKPLLTVPNHLIEQIAAEAYRAFPTANFLIVTRDDLKRDARRLFAARCATGDYDAVVITHEGFSSIPAPEHVERQWLEAQIARFEDYLAEQDYSTSKSTARAIRGLETRLEKLRYRANDPGTITFDQLGIDHVGVDEVNKFRRLPIMTNCDGFSLGTSQRATDLLLKVWWLRQQNPSRPVLAGYSGTPWVNTMAESFVWLTYFAPDVLVDTELESFDAWAAQFVRYETLIEVSPDGSGFRSKRRPAVVQNLPELRTMLQSFMHMVRGDDVGIKRPDVHYHTLTAEPSDEVRDFMRSLVTRADNLREGRVTDPTVDNWLMICSDGRKVGLDARLVGITEPHGHTTKLHVAADNIARIYHANRDRTYPGLSVPGAFQFAACDLGTPHPDDPQTYGKLRTLLIERGVPARMIRFVHDATTPKAREALFASCRSGATAVLLGSTMKVGYGTNMQHRLAAIHHVDITWTPADYEQRNGRGYRTGNLNDSIDIYTYATTSTFDSWQAGIVERTAKAFEHLYRHNSDVREIDDVGELVLNIAQVKALATGSNLLLRQHELRTTVRKLQIARATALQNAQIAREGARWAEERVEQLSTARDKARLLMPHRDYLSEQEWDFTYAVKSARGKRQPNRYGYVGTGPVTVGYDLPDTRDADGDQVEFSAYLDKSYGGMQVVLQVKSGFYGKSTELVRKYVPGEWVKGTYAAMGANLATYVRTQLTQLPQLVAKLDDEITKETERAEKSRVAAAAVMFDRQDELDAARAELDAVDAEIEDTVETAA